MKVLLLSSLHYCLLLLSSLWKLKQHRQYQQLQCFLLCSQQRYQDDINAADCHHAFFPFTVREREYELLGTSKVMFLTMKHILYLKRVAVLVGLHLTPT